MRRVARIHSFSNPSFLSSKWRSRQRGRRHSTAVRAALSGPAKVRELSRWTVPPVFPDTDVVLLSVRNRCIGLAAAAAAGKPHVTYSSSVFMKEVFAQVKDDVLQFATSPEGRQFFHIKSEVVSVGAPRPCRQRTSLIVREMGES